MVTSWIEKKISEIAPLQRGFDLPTTQIRQGKFPVVYSNGIGEHHKYAMVKGPGVVTGRSGTIGSLIFVEEDYFPHNTTLWVVNFNGNCEKFIYYLYHLIDWQKYSTGSGVPTLNRNDIHELRIFMPTDIFEQRAIAAALSDADNYIAGLENLIAKKSAIKKGTMQELLTGKLRLPGFDRNWLEKRINDFGIFKSGNVFPLINQGGYTGFPFYKVSDFNNKENQKKMIKANNYVSQEVADILKCNIMPQGSIVFAKIGAAIFLERKRILATDCCIDNNMMVFIVDEIKGYIPYLYYVMQSINLGDYVTATALPSLSAKLIGQIIKQFPPTKNEQVAIATVISDMDSEIDILTAKLEKARRIKQGMMSELLTGRIRLIQEDAENG